MHRLATANSLSYMDSIIESCTDNWEHLIQLVKCFNQYRPILDNSIHLAQPKLTPDLTQEELQYVEMVSSILCLSTAS